MERETGRQMKEADGVKKRTQNFVWWLLAGRATDTMQ